jgi:hypothetical protein
METPEAGGRKPHNLEKKEVRSKVKKPEVRSSEAAKQQASGPDRGAPDVRESKPSQPNPAEQQASERLGKPPPQEATNSVDNSVQEQVEPQAGAQEESEEIDFPPEVFPSATYVNPLELDRREDDKSAEKR